MASSKRAKLDKWLQQRHELRMQLAQVATRRETFHKTSDGSSLHFYYSQKNIKHNMSRSNMDAQIRNLKKKISSYDEKIDRTRKELNI